MWLGWAWGVSWLDWPGRESEERGALPSSTPNGQCWDWGWGVYTTFSTGFPLAGTPSETGKELSSGSRMKAPCASSSIHLCGLSGAQGTVQWLLFGLLWPQFEGYWPSLPLGEKLRNLCKDPSLVPFSKIPKRRI